MDDEWDSENFNPDALTVKTIVSDKWAGEDEEDDVKDNWEDEEEEKKDEEKQEEIVKPVQVRKKKALAEKLEEKDRKEREEMERKIAAKEALKNLSPEEKAKEKLRQQRLQEEADLQVTKETFGIVEKDNLISIDTFKPSTESDFNILHEAISKKVEEYSSSAYYVQFVENLLRKLCVSINSTDLKKLKTTVDNVYLEKVKAEKAEKNPKKKGKGKAKLMVEGDNEYAAFGAAEYDDFDDFM